MGKFIKPACPVSKFNHGCAVIVPTNHVRSEGSPVLCPAHCRHDGAGVNDPELDTYEAKVEAFDKVWAAFRTKFKGDAEHQARLDNLEKSRAAYRKREVLSNQILTAESERVRRKTHLLERIVNQLQSIQDLVKDSPNV